MVISFGVAFQPEHLSGSVFDSNGVFPWGPSPFRRSPQARPESQLHLQQKAVPRKAKQEVKQEAKQEQRPVTRFDLLLWTLEKLHRPELAQGLAKLPAFAEQRSIKLFCLRESNPAVDILVEMQGFNPTHGSFALAYPKIPNPVIVLIENEITTIASELRLKAAPVRQAVLAHELGHLVGWEVYQSGMNVSANERELLFSEQLAWLAAANLRAQHGSISESEFNRVANWGLASHGLPPHPLLQK